MVEEGVTLTENVLFPFPVVVVPSLRVNVQAPEATTDPVIG